MRAFDRVCRALLWSTIAGGAMLLAAAAAVRPSAGQTPPAASTPPAKIDYAKNIKPLLQARCFACHGALQQQAGLRLDTVDAMLRGGESGPAIVRGDAAKSLLLARVAAADLAERMPPEHEGEPLTGEQIGWLRDWIAAGAAGIPNEQPEADPRDHWAFRPVRRPALPALRAGEAARGPIDALIAARHEQFGLQPQPEAPRLTLLRRLSLDLLGLPPSPDEIQAVLDDSSPDWYERLVDRLLDDPRHGERWARHWMDVWRYSDSWGLGAQLRNSQPHIWHWRDWIVESLNADLPYDEMVRLMLAADELHPADLDKLRATGYLARNYFLFNRHQWMDETVEHVSKGFLGLTLNCSKCHDHKYDPLSQTDYYRLRAIFEPYHVRIDVRPGEADLSKDGIPRVFDGLLDLPTYRLIRGQESQPDTTAPIEPGVPVSLAFRPLSVAPVELPAEAWQPERRAWVIEAHRAAAQRKAVEAEAKVAPARRQLAEAEKLAAELAARAADAPAKPADPVPAPGDGAIVDKFTSLDAARWKLFGGEWAHEPGRLQQKKDGPERAGLRFTGDAPRDFDATLRFTILGGSQWRSVGIGFDVTQTDPTANPGPTDGEQTVYVSAYAGGPKVQGAFQRGGQWQYPTEALAARPIELRREYVLRVQVRDTLVNASLDGRPVIAWRTPVARRTGAWQVTTFDALTVVHEIQLARLADDVRLVEPSGSTKEPTTVEDAKRLVERRKLEVASAELAVAAAAAEVTSVERRGAALQAVWRRTDRDAGRTDSKPDDAETALAREAAKAEREQATAAARLAAVDAELRLLAAAPDKRDAATKELNAAREAVVKAEQKAAEPSEQYAGFMGAAWTPTRFRSSGADDPAVTFPQRSTGRRKALADWIVDPNNPLTARVAVNHLWTRHFGSPLVPTVFDFGRKGVAPAHPELLDWLAAELIAGGWSMKRLHREICLSALYRRSSSAAGADDRAAKDPENVQLWRRPSNRLESQAVRDAVLALAGSLDLSRGGPPVPSGAQEASRRRSLYFFHSNNERNLFLTMFDEALVKECYRREQSIVPQQALALTNSRLVLDAARPIADRLARAVVPPEAPAGATTDATAAAAADDAFIRIAFAAVLGVEPDDAERSAARAALEAWRRLPDSPPGAEGAAAARSNLIWVLLNHNDFVTIR